MIAKAGKSKQHKGSKRGSAETGDVEAAQMPCAVEAAAPVPASANEVENGERPDEREAKKRRTKKNKYDIDIPTFENFEATQLINNVLFGYCSCCIYIYIWKPLKLRIRYYCKGDAILEPLLLWSGSQAWPQQEEAGKETR